MQTQMLVGAIEGGSLVRVVGRGTMQESPAFRKTADVLLKRGMVVFDAAECSYLDSTFLGGLIGVHKAAEQSRTGGFVIAATGPMRVKLFSTSALDKYFRFIDGRPAVLGELKPIDVEDLDTQSLGRHVAVCHASLADQGGPEASTFRSIARRLEEELGER